MGRGRRWRLPPWAGRVCWGGAIAGRWSRASGRMWRSGDLSGIEAAGAWDPVAALVFCGPQRVRDLWVEGRRVVDGGRMATIDLPRVIERQNRLATRWPGGDHCGQGWRTY